MNVFAHTTEGGDESSWQPLDVHLRAVALRAEEAAAAFGSQAWGRLAGLWHDLGKHQPEFQARLRGERVAVEHSGAGAAWGFSRNKELGLPLAFAIAGHHSGLANLQASGAGLPQPLMERLRENAAVAGRLRALADDALLSHPLAGFPDFLEREKTAQDPDRLRLATEFWIRFLFSTLVDADRLDTEAFLDPVKAGRRGGYASIPELRRRLDEFIDRKVAGLDEAAKALPVNQARARVLQACREAAARAPGFYSLAVPTGGGKTLSAMSFALNHAERHGLRRVIAVIPYTSIIEQNAAVYRQALGAENVIEHHSNLDPEKENAAKGVEMAGRHALACENWDAPAIVTTTVQFFESLFSNQPGRCRKLHNIARSVIVLDEVQTLPPGFLLAILDGLSELTAHYGCSVVLSTATPPALAAREGWPHGLAGIREIIPDPKALAGELKRVDYAWPQGEEPVTWDALADELAGLDQVLAVVHRRDDARTLARLIQERVGPGETVIHLSALMCPAHRSETLARVRSLLADGAPCRLVSTQLIEAGVDVDFPVVYRALGGLDSMVQAAGRCNREGRRERGRVAIFRAPSRPPCGTPRKALEAAAALLAERGDALDPADPAIFDVFFRDLYSREALDANNIQRERAQFNFATVGRNFRLIEDGFTQTIVVPYGAAGERLAAVRREAAYSPVGVTRDTLRALQPFTISVYDQAFKKLCKSEALEEVIEGIFTLVTGFERYYDPVFGLIAGDEMQADPGAFVV